MAVEPIAPVVVARSEPVGAGHDRRGPRSGVARVRPRRSGHADPPHGRRPPAAARPDDLPVVADRWPRARAIRRSTTSSTTSPRCSPRCGRRAGSSYGCSTPCPRRSGTSPPPSPACCSTMSRRLTRSSRAVGQTADLWIDAAQFGLGHPALAESAEHCFGIALEALERNNAAASTIDVVAAFADRWPMRGRSPADDRLDAWRRDGTLWPCASRRCPTPTNSMWRTACREPSAARLDRTRAGSESGAHPGPVRRSRRGRPVRAALPVDVAPRLGPRAHRELRGALAASGASTPGPPSTTNSTGSTTRSNTRAGLGRASDPVADRGSRLSGRRARRGARSARQGRPRLGTIVCSTTGSSTAWWRSTSTSTARRCSPPVS